MSADFILALDQGTTSSRALVFDRDRRIAAMAQIPFTQHYPAPGWVEHDPEEIWCSQMEAARQALEQAGLTASDLAAIGLTNQRETTLLWDRQTGAPVHNAIVWQDRRTADWCERWKAEGIEADVTAGTGLRLDPYFSGSKVAWLLENVSELRERAERGEIAFGTVDSFLLWRLTGGRVHATDVTNAARTLLFNIHTGDWDDELLVRFHIPRALLPEVRPSGGYVYGETDVPLLGASVPVAGIAGDQHAALFGQSCFTPGMAKNTYGTGCFLLMNTGGMPVPSRYGLLTTPAWRLGDTPTVYALEGSVFVAGAAVQWLRDELGLIRDAAETETLARSVPDTGGVTFVPAFVGLGAPYWDAEARGALLGLTRGTTPAHIARAALEAGAFSTRDVLDAMQADSGVALTELRVDGGMTANDFLLQMQADVLGIPVVRAANPETTALGAASLAARTVGLWSDTDSPAAMGTRFEPQLPEAERNELYEQWQRAVARVRG